MSRQKNVAASVYARLKNLSKERGVDMATVLRRYAQERLIYRLSMSEEVENFCIKGGLLLSAYNNGDLLRPTEDVDFNGFALRADVTSVEKALLVILSTPVEDDGVVFHVDTMTVKKDRVGSIPGGKISLCANVHTAKVDIRVDVGFGNPITPGVKILSMPTLLDGFAPRPEVLAYPLETIIAEKLHAMAQFGIANTRLKDYYDVWMLMKMHPLSGADLGKAIQNTFEAQGREIRSDLEGLSEDYADEQASAWKAFTRRIGDKSNVSLEEVVLELNGFYSPVLEALELGGAFEGEWIPNAGWSSPSPALN